MNTKDDRKATGDDPKVQGPAAPNPRRLVLPVPPAAPAAPMAMDAQDQTAVPSPQSLPGRPEGAPNVIVILVDDMGFGASSAFGGPCRMRTAERLAEGGLRYSRFHTTAICAPTRAALLSGRNHHSVGWGHLVSSEWPGYNQRRPRSAATLARVLQGNGYATGAFGKWHQVPARREGHVAAGGNPLGPFEYWPTGEGFEKFYGFVHGLMDQWHPLLYEGTTRRDPPHTPAEGYHLSEDLVDQAIRWIRDLRMLRPEDPFFCYLPFGATHEPLHVPPAWSDRYRGHFEHGWEAQRELTLARQKELGVVPPEAELPPWPESIPRWDSWSEKERRASCALMELYAGFAEHMDVQVGRLTAALEELGLFDDTLIFYILGDNGASAEGGIRGKVNMGDSGPQTADDVLAHVDVLGGPTTFPHYPNGWAFALDAPYPWWKQVASHYGGTRNGLIVHWPNGIRARGEVRHQWHHVIDVMPTILEAAGIPQPLIVDGAGQTPIEGTAMNYSFAHADAAERHTTQYFEIGGSRGIYHDGWVACAAHQTDTWGSLRTDQEELDAARTDDDQWELYDTTSDWSQARNVAQLYPERLERLKELFLIEAVRHNVLPLDGRRMRVHNRNMRSSVPSRKSMTFDAGTRAIRYPDFPVIYNTSHSVFACITVAQDGANGVVCAQGGRSGGWALYFDDGRLTYCHNAGSAPLSYVRAPEPISAGVHQLQFRFESDGGGVRSGGRGALILDGEEVARGGIERTALHPREGFDVGIDLGSTVSEEIPDRDNAFTGQVGWVRIDLDLHVDISAEERERIEHEIQ